MQASIFSSELTLLVCLCLAVFRIYLEVVNYNFEKLPLTKSLLKEKASNFHKYGLYLSIGYIVLFAPSFLIVGN